mmetsp:Transcript_35320/g.59857  ORF Transcript_35320/g.59857 Transcript_35320/m.59857 type:complete len:507 (+) Transcript_35320:310-1830(+)
MLHLHRYPVGGWKDGLATDPKSFSLSKLPSNNLRWVIRKGSAFDEDGWEYRFDSQTRLYRWHNSQKWYSFVRRRQIVAFPKKNEEKHHDNHDCPICYSSIREGSAVKTGCNHKFHIKCIEDWMEKQRSCPICRKLISRQNLKALPGPAAKEMLEKMLKRSNAKEGKLNDDTKSPRVAFQEWSYDVGRFLKMDTSGPVWLALHAAIEFLQEIILPEMKSSPIYNNVRRHVRDLRETLTVHTNVVKGCSEDLAVFNKLVAVLARGLENNHEAERLDYSITEAMDRCMQDCERQERLLGDVIESLKQRQDEIDQTCSKIMALLETTEEKRAPNALLFGGLALFSVGCAVVAIVPVVDAVALPTAMSCAGFFGISFQGYMYFYKVVRLRRKLKQAEANLISLIRIVKTRKVILQTVREDFRRIMDKSAGIRTDSKRLSSCTNTLREKVLGSIASQVIEMKLEELQRITRAGMDRLEREQREICRINALSAMNPEIKEGTTCKIASEIAPP